MSKKRRSAKLYPRLDALYDRLPKIACRGLCAESCGPIAMARVEARRIEDWTGELIPPLSGSALVCPFLESDRCTVYPVRPMICRLWGISLTMSCPWGCKPERYLSHEEGLKFLEEARAIAGDSRASDFYILP